MGNLFNPKKTKQNQVSTESKPDRIASTPLFSDDAQSSLDRSRQESAILEVNNDPPCSSKADQGMFLVIYICIYNDLLETVACVSIQNNMILITVIYRLCF